MFSLLDLCPEVLEEIVMKLESVEDVISLGSSSTDLARIVGQERLWRVLLARTELVEAVRGRVMQDRVRLIATFLSSLANSDAFFSLLHQNIYKRYPASGQGWMENSITVSCPTSPQLHSVSGLGLRLLVLIGREEARHTVHKVTSYWISPSLLLSLASLQREQIRELVVEGTSFDCTTEEEGRTLVSFLERCATWSVAWMDLGDEVGGLTWQRLGREVARGTLRRVGADSEVVRRGKREDLRTVWDNTKIGWLVDDEDILKIDGEEEGWGKIEKIIQ